MHNSEFQLGSVYISDFNDREYTFVAIKDGYVWLKCDNGIDRPLTMATFINKYKLKTQELKK